MYRQVNLNDKHENVSVLHSMLKELEYPAKEMEDTFTENTRKTT